MAVLEGAYQTRYRYDAVGNRAGVEVNGSTMVTNVFDGLGRRIRSDYRDAGVWHYLYDAAGRYVAGNPGFADLGGLVLDVDGDEAGAGGGGGAAVTGGERGRGGGRGAGGEREGGEQGGGAVHVGAFRTRLCPVR